MSDQVKILLGKVCLILGKSPIEVKNQSLMKTIEELVEVIENENENEKTKA